MLCLETHNICLKLRTSISYLPAPVCMDSGDGSCHCPSPAEPGSNQAIESVSLLIGSCCGEEALHGTGGKSCRTLYISFCIKKPARERSRREYFLVKQLSWKRSAQAKVHFTSAGKQEPAGLRVLTLKCFYSLALMNIELQNDLWSNRHSLFWTLHSGSYSAIISIVKFFLNFFALLGHLLVSQFLYWPN